MVEEIRHLTNNYFTFLSLYNNQKEISKSPPIKRGFLII